MYVLGKLLSVICIAIGGSYGTYYLVSSSESQQAIAEEKTQKSTVISENVGTEPTAINADNTSSQIANSHDATTKERTEVVSNTDSSPGGSPVVQTTNDNPKGSSDTQVSQPQSETNPSPNSSERSNSDSESSKGNLGAENGQSAEGDSGLSGQQTIGSSDTGTYGSSLAGSPNNGNQPDSALQTANPSQPEVSVGSRVESETTTSPDETESRATDAVTPAVATPSGGSTESQNINSTHEDTQEKNADEGGSTNTTDQSSATNS